MPCWDLSGVSSGAAASRSRSVFSIITCDGFVVGRTGAAGADRKVFAWRPRRRGGRLRELLHGVGVHGDALAEGCAGIRRIHCAPDRSTVSTER